MLLKFFILFLNRFHEKRYDFADGLQATDSAGPGSRTSFTIAGTDRVFHPAAAVIEDDTVLVYSEKVPNPVAVRFGWSNTPSPNLLQSVRASRFAI